MGENKGHLQRARAKRVVQQLSMKALERLNGGRPLPDIRFTDLEPPQDAINIVEAALHEAIVEAGLAIDFRLPQEGNPDDVSS